MDISDLNDHDQHVAKQALMSIGMGLRLDVEYDGLHRLVEVHTVGISTAGNPCMRVYQVMGDSHSGYTEGWKMMSLGKVFKFPQLTDIKSLAPREGYNKGDLGMKHIFTEV
jgi:hypothetical protein